MATTTRHSVRRFSRLIAALTKLVRLIRHDPVYLLKTRAYRRRSELQWLHDLLVATYRELAAMAVDLEILRADYHEGIATFTFWHRQRQIAVEQGSASLAEACSRRRGQAEDELVRVLELLAFGKQKFRHYAVRLPEQWAAYNLLYLEIGSIYGLSQSTARSHSSDEQAHLALTKMEDMLLNEARQARTQGFPEIRLQFPPGSLTSEQEDEFTRWSEDAARPLRWVLDPGRPGGWQSDAVRGSADDL